MNEHSDKIEQLLVDLWYTYKSLKSVWCSVEQPDSVINDHMIDVLSHHNDIDSGHEFAYLLNHFKDILRNSPNKALDQLKSRALNQDPFQRVARDRT